MANTRGRTSVTRHAPIPEEQPEWQPDGRGNYQENQPDVNVNQVAVEMEAEGSESTDSPPLDNDVLQHVNYQATSNEPLSEYQAVNLDISLLQTTMGFVISRMEEMEDRYNLQ